MSSVKTKKENPVLNCNTCKGQCCRYFALQIDTPSSPDEYDHIRWYLTHGKVAIFIEDDDWYLQVNTPCVHLSADYTCGIYEKRPQICRDYGWDQEGDVECHETEKPCDHDHFFSNLDELDKYLLENDMKWTSMLSKK